MQRTDEIWDMTAAEAAMDLCRLLHPSTGRPGQPVVAAGAGGEGRPAATRPLPPVTRLEEIAGYLEERHRRAAARRRSTTQLDRG